MTPPQEQSVDTTQNSDENRNLKSWKRGQSGNPGGRPKTAQFSEEVRQYLKAKDGNRTNLQIILAHLKKHKPEVLLHYAFGRPAETVHVANTEGGDLFDSVVLEMAKAKARANTEIATRNNGAAR